MPSQTPRIHRILTATFISLPNNTTNTAHLVTELDHLGQQLLAATGEPNNAYQWHPTSDLLWHPHTDKPDYALTPTQIHALTHDIAALRTHLNTPHNSDCNTLLHHLETALTTPQTCTTHREREGEHER